MNKRIEYIDALRGLTMILVVIAHINSYTFKAENVFEYTSLTGFLSLFRMPLFFFVSGYIAYKPAVFFDKFQLKIQTFKKVRVLLIPTIVFGSIFVYNIIGGNLISFIESPLKEGYWFTIVSFEMFICYYLICYILRNFSNNSILFDIMSILISFAMLVSVPLLRINENVNRITEILCFPELFKYFQYFVLGLMMSKYKISFEKKLNNQYYVLMIMLCFIVLTYIFNLYVVPNHQILIFKILRFMLIYILGYLGILVMFNTIRKYQDSFTNKTKAGKALQYIGRRTLDIYLLHYFFLPTLPMVGNFFKEYPNMVLELTVGIVLSLLIIGVCLIVSNVLRTSDILGYWLFGAKKIDNK